MFLKNDRVLGVKNGSLATITEVNGSAMRVVLDSGERRELSFGLGNYAALDYGYAATSTRPRGATVDQIFLPASPGIDRHLAYVGMTHHREGAELYAGRDDFKGFDELKASSHGRGKRTLPSITLRYRSLEAARAQRTEQERQQPPRAAARAKTAAGAGIEGKRHEKAEAGQGDPVARFKQAQKEFIQVFGLADFDPQEGPRGRVARGDEPSVRSDRHRPQGMSAAEREGFAPQVRTVRARPNGTWMREGEGG
ncbi:MAG TPA: hypothetical protein VHY56_09155 [Candidatus Binataceae bacterium]|jgi:hypothetical protein|nr:hypothetical protein [Candidatus Binataceae bacterium]